MNKKDVLKIALLDFAFFLLGTLLFVLSFSTPIFGWVSILFYRGIYLLVFASLLMLAIMLIFKKSKYGRLLTYRDLIMVMVLFVSINIMFFTLVPVTIERSVSVYMLGYLDKNSNVILTDSQLSDAFVKQYVKDDKAMDKRLNEQIYSGNVSSRSGGYIITERGKSLVNIFLIIARIFNVNTKIIKE